MIEISLKKTILMNKFELCFSNSNNVDWSLVFDCSKLVTLKDNFSTFRFFLLMEKRVFLII